MNTRRAGSIALGFLIGIGLWAGLATAGVVPPPWDLHDTTGHSPEWGIRTVPQEQQ